MSIIARCDIGRVAEIRPQLEHKPTWHGLVRFKAEHGFDHRPSPSRLPGNPDRV